MKTTPPRLKTVAAVNGVDGHEADVVPGVPVGIAGIAQSHQQLQGKEACGGLFAAGCPCLFRGGRGGLDLDARCGDGDDGEVLVMRRLHTLGKLKLIDVDGIADCKLAAVDVDVIGDRIGAAVHAQRVAGGLQGGGGAGTPSRPGPPRGDCVRARSPEVTDG